MNMRVFAAFALIALVSERAQAAEPAAEASFALIIGVNQPPDADVAPLRYADDDAARYRDLFQSIGAETRLLARLDENTARLHGSAAKEARPPRWNDLLGAVDEIAAGVAAARKRGAQASLYVFYAGHGGDDGRAGYITLEDRHVTGPDLITQIFDRVGATHNHLVVDACSAYMLAVGRGRGGKRRPLQGFAHPAEALMERTDIGLMLATSSARESHEWAAFQAGVFSHEVRSGLFGAADTSGDGRIDYAELGAFVARANQSVVNERFRPDVFWRAPRSKSERTGDGVFVDLRSALARRVDVPASKSGHYVLEDAQGVRLADFHNGKSVNVRLIRPAAVGAAFLERASDGYEVALPAEVPVIDLGRTEPAPPHVASRNAAHEAFSSLFSLPLDGGENANAASLLGAGAQVDAKRNSSFDTRNKIGWGLVVVAGVTAVVGAELLLSAQSAESENVVVGGMQSSVGGKRLLGWTATAVSGIAAASGATLLLWRPGLNGDGLALGYAARF